MSDTTPTSYVSSASKCVWFSFNDLKNTRSNRLTDNAIPDFVKDQGWQKNLIILDSNRKHLNHN